MIDNFACCFVFEDKSIVVSRQNVYCCAAASFSAVLSAAAYILGKFPKINHPKDLSCEVFEDNYQYPTPTLSNHPYFYSWCKFLSECILLNQAVTHNRTLYFYIALPAQCFYLISQNTTDFELRQYQPEWQILSPQQRIMHIFKCYARLNTKRVAFFNNSTEPLIDNPYQPRVNIVAVILGSIYNNYQWTKYNILENELPSFEELCTFDCVILSGSSLCVMDHHEEIDRATYVLFKAYEHKGNLRILGICFGHQLIANQHRARLVKKEFIARLEKIEFDRKTVLNYGFLEPLTKRGSSLLLSEHHEDFVYYVPEGFTLLAQSYSCKVYGLVSNDGRMLSVQFHSEYCQSYTQGLQYRCSKYFKRQYLPYLNDLPKQCHHFQSSQAIKYCFSLFINSP